ncbi:MAG: hypothetical protein K1X87_07655 [Dehalococcoidia bacterium]|nr:hypothetical protein [Dehalococcoidia bacterium]
MTTERRDDEEFAGAPTEVCDACGHADRDHEVRELDGDGAPAERGFCLECGDWHDFVPAPPVTE